MYLGPFTHQATGLNRAGRYLETAREKGTDRTGDGETGRRGERRNERWRRITGIFPHVEMSLKERRAGLARLAAWIQFKIQNAKFKMDSEIPQPGSLSLERRGETEASGTPATPNCAGVPPAFIGEGGPKMPNELYQPLSHKESKTPSYLKPPNASCEFGVEIEAQGQCNVTPHPGIASLARPSPTRSEGNDGRFAVGAGRMPAVQLSFAEDWDVAPKDWACARETSVERLCVQLGLSCAALTALMKEYCGLSAGAFVDGLKIKNLKPMLFEKIRAAAFELWGAPGSFVWEKLAADRLGDWELGRLGETARTGEGEKGKGGDNAERVGGAPLPRGGELESRFESVALENRGDAEHAGAPAMRRVAVRARPSHHLSQVGSRNRQSPKGRFAKSRYFRVRPEALFEESRAEERARRLDELCEMLNAWRGRTGGEATGGTQWRGCPAGEFDFAERVDPCSLFNLETFALNAGFASAARLKRACLNVFGKTLRQLEEVLAEEVLQFYLCAEDKELREIASRENEIAIVFRARELYHKSEDAPKPPYLDEWSKFKELKPHWLSQMREMFAR